MNHIIQKQILELTLDEGPERVTLHDDVVRRFKENTVPALGELFDKLAPEHLFYKIEKLEVNLGAIHPADLEKELVAQIEKLLQTELRGEDNDLNKERLKTLSKEQSIFQQFLFFLKNGHFSWNANGLSLAQMEMELSHVLTTLTSNQQKELLKTIANASSMERLKVQFSKGFHNSLGTILLPFTDFKVWKKILLKVLPHSVSRDISIQALSVYARNPGVSELPFILELFKQLTVHSKLIDVEISTLRKNLLAEARRVIPAKAEELVEAFKANQKTDLIISEEKFRESDPVKDKYSDTVYIKNAGLVLLWPYLQRFFSNLKLITGQQFNDRSSTEKAARILHFLVLPTEPLAENLLPLNKILCGLDVNDLVPTLHDSGKPFVISDKEIKAGKELIKAIIKNWGTIGNTSVKGFQTSFLQRDGKLEKDENGWRLKIEQRSYDMLLDSLPWNINLIKLPWMPKPLHVEW